MKHQRSVKYILSLAAAALLIWFSFRGVDWKEFLNGLRSCRWEMVLLSMAAGLCAFFFRALRWRRIMLPIFPEVDRLTVFNAINIGNMSNFVLQYLGEFVKTGVVLRRRKGREEPGFEKVLGTVVLERGWDIMAPAFLFAILLIFGWDEFGEFFRRQMWDGISGRFNSTAIWLVAAAAALLLGLLTAIFLLRHRVALFERIFEKIKGLLQGVTSCLTMEQKWLFFLYTSIIWTMYWLMMVFCIAAFPVSATAWLILVDALFLMLVGSFASFVPVPGGFGAYHFLVSMALSAIWGFSRADGMVFATIAHESQALNMIIWGLGSYISETVRAALADKARPTS